MNYSHVKSSRRKQNRFIITFHTTQEAMAAEVFLKENGFPGRLIPVPREITAGCGLAWMAPPEAGEGLLKGMKEAGLRWQEAGEFFV